MKLPQPGDPCLSVRQPWTWMIVRPDLTGEVRIKAFERGVIKPVENRSWPTRFRGRFWIHAAKGLTKNEYIDARVWAVFNAFFDTDPMPALDEFDRGEIIGSADLWDCTKERRSCWHMENSHGFYLRDIEPLETPIPCKGALGFFPFRPAAGEAQKGGAGG